MSEGKQLTYREAGVDVDAAHGALSRLVAWVGRAGHDHCDGSGVGQSILESGFFASVLDLGNNTGLAITTDGVGTKLRVAEMADRYDTVGIDCVAMNVNDLVCVGARPIAMVDYLAVQRADPAVFEKIGEGLYRGAELANVSIPGGEISQIGEMLHGYRDGSGFDLVGTAVGTVALDGLVVGDGIDEDDVVVGLKSNGLHSNGFSLARRVLFEQLGLSIHEQVSELGHTVGDELLRPTAIYVRAALDMLSEGARVKAFSHITGDGLLNLLRVRSPVGFKIESVPEPDPVFDLIQSGGKVSDEEMFTVFNMGVGFAVVVPMHDAELVKQIAGRYGFDSWHLGYPLESLDGKVMVEPRQLIGEGDRFRTY